MNHFDVERLWKIFVMFIYAKTAIITGKTITQNPIVNRKLKQKSLTFLEHTHTHIRFHCIANREIESKKNVFDYIFKSGWNSIEILYSIQYRTETSDNPILNLLDTKLHEFEMISGTVYNIAKQFTINKKVNKCMSNSIELFHQYLQMAPCEKQTQI